MRRWPMPPAGRGAQRLLEAFAGDLSGPAQAAALIALFPRVDILVNRQGIFDLKPFEKIGITSTRTSTTREEAQRRLAAC